MRIDATRRIVRAGRVVTCSPDRWPPAVIAVVLGEPCRTSVADGAVVAITMHLGETYRETVPCPMRAKREGRFQTMTLTVTAVGEY